MKALLLKAVEALKIAEGALCQVSPCMWEECKQDQMDWLEAARDLVTPAIADLEAAIREQPGEAPWCHCASHGEPRCAEQCRECAEVDAVAPLKDEGEARDAARYRWLRDTSDELWPLALRMGFAATEVDAAIDAALSGKAQP